MPCGDFFCSTWPGNQLQQLHIIKASQLGTSICSILYFSMLSESVCRFLKTNPCLGYRMHAFHPTEEYKNKRLDCTLGISKRYHHFLWLTTAVCYYHTIQEIGGRTIQKNNSRLLLPHNTREWWDNPKTLKTKHRGLNTHSPPETPDRGWHIISGFQEITFRLRLKQEEKKKYWTK